MTKAGKTAVVSLAVFGAVAVAASLGAGILFGIVNPAFRPSLREVSRAASPDGKVDAVLVEGGGNATVGFFYNAYVVPAHGRFQEGNKIFAADRVDGLKLRWERPQHLEIEYKAARIFAYENQWQTKEVDNFNYLVKVHLLDLGYEAEKRSASNRDAKH